MADPMLIARAHDKDAFKDICLLPRLSNRHGLITGATGTGKTVTLQKLAEAFANIGVPVFVADIKGDLSGIGAAGVKSDKLMQRLAAIGIDEYIWAHLVGIYFDVPVVAAVFLPVWIWVIFGGQLREKQPWINKTLFLLAALTTLIFNGIDTGYSQVTAKRSGFELFDMLGDDANKLTPYILDNLGIILGLAALGYFLFRIIPVLGQYPQVDFKGRPLRGLITAIAFAATCLVGFRGGLQLRPLRAIDASTFVAPEIAPLVTSTPLQIISTWQRNGLPNFDFAVQWPNNATTTNTTDWLLKNTQPLPEFPMPRSQGGGWVQPNIVFIVVEILARD